jgi:hypothetical protein
MNRDIMHEHQHDTNECGVPALPQRQPNGDLNDAWREVGAQFQLLGSRLAAAIRESWDASGGRSGSDKTLRHLSDDLREAANRVERVIDDVSEETREERRNTLRVTRRASEQSLEEARVLTAATLRKLNRQLDLLADRMEKNRDS